MCVSVLERLKLEYQITCSKRNYKETKSPHELGDKMKPANCTLTLCLDQKRKWKERK